MRSLRPFALTTLCLLFATGLSAQWQSLGSNITTFPRSVYGLSAPNASTIWAVTIHPSFTAPARQFTRSFNGGVAWQSGVIDPTNGADFTAISIFALDQNNAWVTMADLGTQRLGRIYKTSNGGINWVEQVGSFRNLNNGVQAVHFFDQSVGFAYGSAATGDPQADTLRIWRSTNGGTSWPRIPAAALPTPLAGEGVWVYYGNGSYDVAGDTIWFGTRRGRVWRSPDRGVSWQAFSVGADVPVYSVAFTNARRGIATSDGRAFRTWDGGLTWEEITSLPASFVYYQIAKIPDSDGAYGLVYEGSDMFYNDFRFAYTLNDGDDWEMTTPRPIEVITFLSPTQGWGGGRVLSSSNGGVYRWTGSIGPVTSTHEMPLDEQGLRIYPNPFAEGFTIEWEAERSTPMDYAITDLTGKTLQAGRFDRPVVGMNRFFVSFEATAGMYLLVLKQQNATKTIKLVKQ
ncbi:MAG TPA: T9SS type A sorting domain-containing protein [Saprospiraceae bacterium]|nr:T9SS type A sorting domain-containing protein [Saprospiraceae bacterium]HMP26314.1 T9SS type A sorting domain-containing protein [Saprospiraceae bacterium]